MSNPQQGFTFGKHLLFQISTEREKLVGHWHSWSLAGSQNWVNGKDTDLIAKWRVSLKAVLKSKLNVVSFPWRLRNVSEGFHCWPKLHNANQIPTYSADRILLLRV